jgi:DNA topoisomerase IA
MVNAQQARRVLDCLVGYELPVLYESKKVVYLVQQAVQITVEKKEAFKNYIRIPL